MNNSWWHLRLICLYCAWHIRVVDEKMPSFIIERGCCPSCGEPIQWKDKVKHKFINGFPFIYQTMRWHSRSIWWNPLTWGKGRWEIKPPERK